VFRGDRLCRRLVGDSVQSGLALRSLSLRLQDIAEGEGDLTRRIDVDGNNEIDEVGHWFNVFIERIEQIVRQVAIHAQTLGAAATELALTAQETASQATTQKNRQPTSP